MDKFRDVQDAYKVLSTPELKAELDKIAMAAVSKKAGVSAAKIVPGWYCVSISVSAGVGITASISFCTSIITCQLTSPPTVTDYLFISILQRNMI